MNFCIKQGKSSRIVTSETPMFKLDLRINIKGATTKPYQMIASWTFCALSIDYDRLIPHTKNLTTTTYLNNRDTRLNEGVMS